jgi:AcrR family transcriptional regulator
MSDDVKPTRRYEGARRQEQARQTRRAMLTAARDLFLERRFAGTTLAMVADAAGVSVQNVYKVFGNKAGLVKAVFDVSIAGDDEPVAVRDRESISAVRAEPDPGRKLLLYGRHLAGVGPRIMPLLLVVRDAAATDEAAAEAWAVLQDERLTGMGLFADALSRDGHLRPGVSRDEARDVLWAHNSLELWDLLVTQRGWAADQYGQWIGRQLAAALLSPGEPDGAGAEGA